MKRGVAVERLQFKANKIPKISDVLLDCKYLNNKPSSSNEARVERADSARVQTGAS